MRHRTVEIFPPVRFELFAVAARAALFSLLLSVLLGSCRSAPPPNSRQEAVEGDDPEADAAMVEGRWEVSADLHRELLRREPESGLAMYHLGFSLGSLGRHAEEVVWYERAIAAGYKSPDLLYNLGLARLALGELEAAEETLGQALAARPEEAEFHYAAARVALAQGADARARAHLERATQLDPDHREAWSALAALYERLGEHASAQAARAHLR